MNTSEVNNQNNLNQRTATIQVDIDPFWYIASVYQRNSGTEVAEIKQTIYEAALPQILHHFAEYGVKATFFVVGKDLEDPRNLSYMEQILAEGHELANHSYSHRMDFKKLPSKQIIEEIDRCHKLAKERLGIEFKGFKAPAYGISSTVMQDLISRGYLYDSSVHPNCTIPAVKAWQKYVLQYKKGMVEFGEWRSTFAPLHPYWPGKSNLYHDGGDGIVELPVSTMPFLRLPFHFSFINVFGYWWFLTGWFLWRRSRLSFLNYAFHAIDILDPAQIPDCMVQRPGAMLPGKRKAEMMSNVLKRISTSCVVMRSDRVAEKVGFGRGYQ